MPIPKPNKLVIEDAQIRFKNFSGAAGLYNAEGDRNFCLFIDDQLADALRRDFWNVKTLKPKEEGDPPQAYIEVKVNYANKPPRVFLVTSRGKKLLTESQVGMVDWAEIVTVDLTVNPSVWNVNGKEGVKAYLQSMFVTIVEDPTEMKYYDVPDSAANILQPVDESSYDD